MIYVRPISGLHKDYLVRSLRSEMDSLGKLMDSLENSERCETRYVEESLKAAEIKLKSLGHFLRDY